MTGEIRYVGKCDDPKTRLPGHLKDPRRNHRTNWLRSLTRQGLKPSLEVIAEVPWDAWPFWERSYIRAYRCLGFDLVNISDGGEGGARSGKNHHFFGKKFTPAHRAKLGSPGEKNPNFGKTMAAEQRAKISATKTGNSQHTPEMRAKQSAAQLGKKMPGNTSGFVGVSWRKTKKKWAAFLSVNYKCVRLGDFKKLEDAVFVRNLAFDKYYGSDQRIRI